MRFSILVICALLSVGAFARETRDSVGVENSNGLQVILHRVKAKETYYSIARIYQVAPKTVISFNNNIPLQIGMLVKVPTLRNFSSNENTSKNSTQKSPANIIEYKVGPREYLYSIAKKFETTPEAIKELNNLRSNNLSIGQILRVPAGKLPSKPIESAPRAIETPANNPVPLENPNTTPAGAEIPKPKVATARLGLQERTERGVAVWIADENLDGTKMLALHPTAPVGTIIKITNPMTERSTFVKVVGRFTENESTKDVIIVITKASADLLGALDKRFQARIDYGVPHE